MNDYFRIGKFTGTGAALTVSLGWIPDYVKCVNYTDGDRIDEWFRNDGAGTSTVTTTAVAANADNGITAYAGSETAAPGFTVGTDISESAKVINFIAMRNDGRIFSATYP
ncbi:MAG: hypothetical protein ABL951_05640 [Alphaproteobacteria bacterium]